MTAIDGIPVPFARTKAAFLEFADKIGNDGLLAIADASVGQAEPDAAAPLAPEAELSAARSS